VPRLTRLDDVLGDGFAVLAPVSGWLRDVDESTLDYFARLGTRYLALVTARTADGGSTGSDHGAPRHPIRVRDVDGVLRRWLSRGGAGAVLLRPDRVVALAGPRPDLVRWRASLVGAGLHGGWTGD
jgi:hypothetical protein